MTRKDRRVGRSLAAACLAAAGIAGADGASALDIEVGDLVGVFQKNGFEVIVNLGPATPGGRLDLADTLDIPAFEGGLGGEEPAKFVAIAVEDPDRTIDCCGSQDLPLSNIIVSSLGPTATPQDFEVSCAMNNVESSDPLSGVWFNRLRALPGTDFEVLEVTHLDSYEASLGFGTDAVLNCFNFSTAGVFSEAGLLQMNLLSLERGYSEIGGPPASSEAIVDLSFNGTTLDLFEPVPEPAAALLTLCGAAVLAAAARSRSRRSLR